MRSRLRRRQHFAIGINQLTLRIIKKAGSLRRTLVRVGNDLDIFRPVLRRLAGAFTTLLQFLSSLDGFFRSLDQPGVLYLVNNLDSTI
ncbi:hypothetical protein D3C73_1532600 [compost metagenome]